MRNWRNERKTHVKGLDQTALFFPDIYVLLKRRSQISNTDTASNYLHPSVRRQLGKELLGQIFICNLHLLPRVKVWDTVLGTVQTWDSFCPLCFTDSQNAVQQSTSQIFGKSRRWERYQGATRVFIYHRPAVLIAEQFRIFLIIIYWWVTEIPQIISANLILMSSGGEGKRQEASSKKSRTLHANYYFCHIPHFSGSGFE